MPALNTDVLLDIMAVSDRSVISRLMQTSRLFVETGAKHLLDEKSIRLHTERDLDSFVDFLATRQGYRIHFLRGLGLEMQVLKPSVAKRLDSLFNKHASQISITLLYIRFVDSLLYPWVFFAGTFTRLTTIEESKIKTAVLEWILPPDLDPLQFPEQVVVEEDARNAILALRTFQSSLKILKTNRGQLQRFDGDNTFDEVYTGVTELSCNNIMVDSMSTVAIARAFPNLKVFSMVKNRTWMEDREELDRQHEKNVSEQTREGSWKSLRLFAARLNDLYVLSPICHIHGIHVAGPKMHVRSLRRILKRTRPLQLSLLEYEGNLFTPGLTEMLRKPCVEQVECLEVILQIGQTLAPELIDGEAMVESWVTGISGLPRLRVLSLGLFCTLARTSSPDSASSHAEVFLMKLDLDVLMQRCKKRLHEFLVVIVKQPQQPQRL
ncbi:uncharacterized protein BXZ73DRAFT_104470 [Epithele typhae]|uniref:uncharacterized protein n=1 Tax=Epithele typhae TaxID=378194 RepID=UPI002008AEAA|nr:uncharacterized protein BXZ73DRAFT_104470 [Epithele typhae]KAH9921183.1 hypothetical protein BXZ73DRAFT_104470 [Epithele typhae]